MRSTQWALNTRHLCAEGHLGTLRLAESPKSQDIASVARHLQRLLFTEDLLPWGPTLTVEDRTRSTPYFYSASRRSEDFPKASKHCLASPCHHPPGYAQVEMLLSSYTPGDCRLQYTSLRLFRETLAGERTKRQRQQGGTAFSCVTLDKSPQEDNGDSVALLVREKSQ